MRRGTLCALGLASAAALSAACGFHPRGSVFPSGDPGRLFVDADRGLSVEEALRRALRERDFVLVSDRDAADVVLRVSNEQQTRRIVSVRSTGRVSEFELAHAVSMRIDRTPDLATGPDDPATDVGPDLDGGDTDPGAIAPSLDDGDVVLAGTEAAPPERADRVVVTREYTYDESQVLGKENEARILRLEMSEELVRQVVLRTIASLAPRAAQGDTLPRGDDPGPIQ